MLWPSQSAVQRRDDSGVVVRMFMHEKNTKSPPKRKLTPICSAFVMPRPRGGISSCRAEPLNKNEQKTFTFFCFKFNINSVYCGCTCYRELGEEPLDYVGLTFEFTVTFQLKLALFNSRFSLYGQSCFFLLHNHSLKFTEQTFNFILHIDCQEPWREVLEYQMKALIINIYVVFLVSI